MAELFLYIFIRTYASSNLNIIIQMMNCATLHSNTVTIDYARMNSEFFAPPHHCLLFDVPFLMAVFSFGHVYCVCRCDLSVIVTIIFIYKQCYYTYVYITAILYTISNLPRFILYIVSR